MHSLFRMAPVVLVLPLLVAVLDAAPGTTGTAATVLTGPPRVIDADSFEIDGRSLRLLGIDAPEHGQTCTDPDGSDWPCGDWATAQVRDLVGDRAVRCAGDESDRYDRLLVSCTLHGADLNGMIVRDGYATAYRDYGTPYEPQEAEARAARRGIWRGEVMAPAEWRAAARARTPAVVDTPPVLDSGSICAIKGNVSDSGQIYHVPGSRHYEETQISLSRGERWFCSESEAVAAGWRAPRG